MTAGKEKGLRYCVDFRDTTFTKCVFKMRLGSCVSFLGGRAGEAAITEASFRWLRNVKKSYFAAYIYLLIHKTALH